MVGYRYERPKFDDDELGRIARRDWLDHEHSFDPHTTKYSGETIEQARRDAAARRWHSIFSSADTLSMSGKDICDMADYFAHELAARRVDVVDIETGYKHFMAVLFPDHMAAKCRLAVLAKINLFNFKHFAARLCCARWWRSKLRRWVVQSHEAWAIENGKVGAAAGAWYCSDRALAWRVKQLADSEAMMRATVIENESGEAVTLWEAASSTVSNKANRRNELMTRIRGCEQWATENQLVGFFTTNTCPSRFHARRVNGSKNPKYDGSTPDKAQAWLNETWARCRALLNRQGVKVMGFRVAEPHHDACPHWHMLLWVKECDIKKLKKALATHWLREPEFGSDKHRLKIKLMIGGKAAGYIAKYIAKNIDDYQIDKHHDHDDGGKVEDSTGASARRVDAWASTWRIRQFQAIGQPSVTVWRELRRTTKEAAAGGSDILIRAWLSVHRKGESMACWQSYMTAQGGALRRRKDYALCTYSLKKLGKRYGDTLTNWTCGIRESALGVDTVTPTKRKQWGGAGFAGFCQVNEVNAWTRLNNCTLAKKANRSNLTKTIDAWRDFEGKPLDEWQVDDAKAAQFDDFWAAQNIGLSP